MKAASEKLVNATNEVRDYLVKEGFEDSQTFEEMDERTLKLLQLASKLVTASNELTLKTAEMIESIDEKLNAVNKKLGL